jgi:phospholipid transport system substrate-binding protein
MVPCLLGLDSAGSGATEYSDPTESIEGDQATIRTKILTKQRSEVPVDYRLLREGDRWRVYDVVIEGVSLISNYRNQFNKIIQTSSFNDLIAKLRAKEFSKT